MEQECRFGVDHYDAVVGETATLNQEVRKVTVFAGHCPRSQLFS